MDDERYRGEHIRTSDAESREVRRGHDEAHQAPRERRVPKTDSDFAHHGADNAHGSSEQDAMSLHAQDEPNFQEAAAWSRGGNLDAPPSRAGYVQRWIRVEMMDGRPDTKNISVKTREGWRPRSVESCPEDFRPQTMHHPRFGDVIAVAGMVLMEMPESFADQRDAYFAAKTRRQAQAVDDEVHRVEQAGGPKVMTHAKSRVSRRPPTAGD